MNKILKVKCPKCKTTFNYIESKFRPFCSERCKEVDLGNWFTENYRLPSKEKLNDEDLDIVIKEMSQEEHEE